MYVREHFEFVFRSVCMFPTWSRWVVTAVYCHWEDSAMTRVKRYRARFFLLICAIYDAKGWWQCRKNGLYMHCQNEIVLSVGELQYEYDNKTSNKKFWLTFFIMRKEHIETMGVHRLFGYNRVECFFENVSKCFWI